MWLELAFAPETALGVAGTSALGRGPSGVFIIVDLDLASGVVLALTFNRITLPLADAEAASFGAI